MDEHEQIASEGKETLNILKGKINEKFQNEEKIKKSEEREREREREEKERERKHGLEKQKIEFERERIQAEEIKLKMTMEKRLTMDKLIVEKMKIEMQEKLPS